MTDEKSKLAPLLCHGVHFTHTGKKGQWQGDCPFCGKEGHFFGDPSSGLWDCKVCGATGNPVGFLTDFAEHAYQETSRVRHREISKLRGIPSGVLKKRRVSHDGNGGWLVPVFSKEGTVRDIRRYDGKQMKSTTGCKTQLFGADRLAKARSVARVWLCEGEWDAMAMDWLLRELGADPRDEVAVAVPGATVFKADWSPLFEHKRVVAVYDADDAGERGEMLAKQRLEGVAGSIEYVRWPDKVKKGFDLRDFIRKHLKNDGDPQKAMGVLTSLLRGEPKQQIAGSDEMPSWRQRGGSAPKPQSWKRLLETFEAELEMGADLEMALLISLAVTLSNNLRTDSPLWVYIAGPPGCGKTAVLSAFQSSGHTVFRSTLTPHCLVSGWRGEGGDPSLIPKLKGRTFVLKDFTEILTMPGPAQDEIYSTLRGAYDGGVSKTFGNGITREFKNCWFSTLAGVTPAIHGHDRASLGERFLKFNFRAFTKQQQEDLIEAGIEDIGREQEREEVLQEAVARFLNREVTIQDLPPISPKMRKRVSALCQLTAHMRAQVDRDVRTGEIRYRPPIEVPIRLAKQISKLGRLVAYIRKEKEVSERSYHVMERVAFDTAYGFHLDVVTALMEMGGTGSKTEVRDACGLPGTTLDRRFENLQVLRAIEPAGVREGAGPGRPGRMWKVTDSVATLWKAARGVKQGKTKKTRKKKKRG